MKSLREWRIKESLRLRNSQAQQRFESDKSDSEDSVIHEVSDTLSKAISKIKEQGSNLSEQKKRTSLAKSSIQIPIESLKLKSRSTNSSQQKMIPHSFERSCHYSQFQEQNKNEFASRDGESVHDILPLDSRIAAHRFFLTPQTRQKNDPWMNDKRFIQSLQKSPGYYQIPTEGLDLISYMTIDPQIN